MNRKYVLTAIALGLFVTGGTIMSQGLPAWTNPVLSPPSGNVAKPINEGSDLQIKSGNFGVERLAGDNAELKIQSKTGVNEHWGIYHDRVSDELRFWNDDNRVAITSSGNLDLNGNNITDVNKITANIFDPIYLIEGEQYATYAGESIGLQMDYTLEGETQDGEYFIELSQQDKGSDLWLFYNTVQPDTITSFVSSHSESHVYAHIDDSVVAVKTKDIDTSFTLRLTAKPIHSDGWGNIPSEESGVYIDVDLYRD